MAIDKDPSEEMANWPDEALLRAAHGGDVNAYQMFCIRSLTTLKRFLTVKCRELAIPMSQVDDFAQETMVRALRQIESTHVPAGHPLPRVSRAWLRQIAYNIALDWLRRNRHTQAWDPEVMANRFAAEPIPDMEQREQILKFFDHLLPEEREVLELFLIKELSGSQAADELAISRDAAYKRYERALKRLREWHDAHGSS